MSCEGYNCSLRCQSWAQVCMHNKKISRIMSKYFSSVFFSYNLKIPVSNKYKIEIIDKLKNVYRVEKSSLCVEWNEIAIRIFNGNPGSLPLWTPQIIVNIWDTIPQIFWWRNMRICWSGRPQILADTLPTESTSAWKKGWKMTIMFWPSDYCRKWPKNFKTIFGACFRYTLHELKQIVEKKTKMTKFDDFLEIFTMAKKFFSKKLKFLVVKNQK